MLLGIDVGIMLCAPVEIHIEFQLLLVQYYSYQVRQNGSNCLWKICRNGSKCLWIQQQEESVITITLCGISNFYRGSLHTRTTVSKNLDRSAKWGNENKRPRGHAPGRPLYLKYLHTLVNTICLCK
jgi:hypothetical protein